MSEGAVEQKMLTCNSNPGCHNHLRWARAHDADDARREQELADTRESDRQARFAWEERDRVIAQAREALSDLIEWVKLDGSEGQIIDNALGALAAIDALHR